MKTRLTLHTCQIHTLLWGVLSWENNIPIGYDVMLSIIWNAELMQKRHYVLNTASTIYLVPTIIIGDWWSELVPKLGQSMSQTLDTWHVGYYKSKNRRPWTDFVYLSQLCKHYCLREISVEHSGWASLAWLAHIQKTFLAGFGLVAKVWHES